MRLRWSLAASKHSLMLTGRLSWCVTDHSIARAGLLLLLPTGGATAARWIVRDARKEADAWDPSLKTVLCIYSLETCYHDASIGRQIAVRAARQRLVPVEFIRPTAGLA